MYGNRTSNSTLNACSLLPRAYSCMLCLRASDSTPRHSKVSDMKQRRRRRRRRCRKCGDAGVILPTELVLEILKRATPSTVARCAVTCRPWLRLVSRRSFARRAARPRRALLLGFFAFDHAEDDEQAMLLPRFVESPCWNTRQRQLNNLDRVP